MLRKEGSTKYRGNEERRVTVKGQGMKVKDRKSKESEKERMLENVKGQHQQRASPIEDAKGQHQWTQHQGTTPRDNTKGQHQRTTPMDNTGE